MNNNKTITRRRAGRLGTAFAATAFAGALALSSPQQAVAGDAFDYDMCVEATDVLYDTCAGDNPGWVRRSACSFAKAGALVLCATVEALDITM